MYKNLAVAATIFSLLLAPQGKALETDDLLALVAMPLAVAAVSEITDVPSNELMNVVSLLNDAAVPDPQFIEVIRYVPVALVVETEGPTFVEFLRAREVEGVRGLALVNSIEQRLEFYDLRDLDLAAPRPRIIEVVESVEYIPPVVRTRLANRSAHPHGGPPGQLKKELGLQTGAEVVHGSSRRRGDDDGRDAVTRSSDRDRSEKPRKAGKAEKADGKKNAIESNGGQRRDDDDRGRGNEGKGNKGKGKGNDNGKGKSKGKG